MRILRSIPAAAGAPIALTIGNFDGVHLGHQAMLARLREAARREALPACAMTFEPHPREFFAPDQAPARLTPLARKLELLAAEGVHTAYVCRRTSAPVAGDRNTGPVTDTRWLPSDVVLRSNSDGTVLIAMLASSGADFERGVRALLDVPQIFRQAA